MIKVTAREDETFDSLLKRFKKQVNASGIIQECRKREYFLKKSLKRKEKSKMARMKAMQGR